MNIELIRNYCMDKKGATESFPFDSDTLVFKVMGKMFLLTSLSEPEKINVKCDPETAIDLREKYDAVLPGYHMNKKHWNTIDMAQGLTDSLTHIAALTSDFIKFCAPIWRTADFKNPHC